MKKNVSKNFPVDEREILNFIYFPVWISQRSLANLTVRLKLDASFFWKQFQLKFVILKALKAKLVEIRPTIVFEFDQIGRSLKKTFFGN